MRFAFSNWNLVFWRETLTPCERMWALSHSGNPKWARLGSAGVCLVQIVWKIFENVNYANFITLKQTPTTMVYDGTFPTEIRHFLLYFNFLHDIFWAVPFTIFGSNSIREITLSMTWSQLHGDQRFYHLMKQKHGSPNSPR